MSGPVLQLSLFFYALKSEHASHQITVVSYQHSIQNKINLCYSMTYSETLRVHHIKRFIYSYSCLIKVTQWVAYRGHVCALTDHRRG